jgi:hypothetical protein
MSWFSIMILADWLGGPWLLVPMCAAVLAAYLVLREPARKEGP